MFLLTHYLSTNSMSNVARTVALIAGDWKCVTAGFGDRDVTVSVTHYRLRRRMRRRERRRKRRKVMR